MFSLLFYLLITLGMKKTPKLDLNSFDFEGSNHDKLFLANYHELRKTYEELFYEELKESAEKA